MDEDELQEQSIEWLAAYAHELQRYITELTGPLTGRAITEAATHTASEPTLF
jgi:hypothetical protein